MRVFVDGRFVKTRTTEEAQTLYPAEAENLARKYTETAAALLAAAKVARENRV